MHIFKHIMITLLALLILAGCSGGEDAAQVKEQGPDLKASIPAAAPVAAKAAPRDGAILDLDAPGLAAYLADHKGTPTLVMLWATWCPSCKKQIPELEKLEETHGDKVNIIALSVDETRQALERYLAKKPIALTVAWGDQQIASDNRVEAIPTLLIFDKNGAKIFGQAGVFPASMLGVMADKLVEE